MQHQSGDAPAPSTFRRLLALLLAPIRGLRDPVTGERAARQCLRCGTVYDQSGAVHRPGDAEDDDVIEQRMSRLHSQMSGFSASVPPLAPAEPDPLNRFKVQPKEQMRKCPRCGHFALAVPASDACPSCGRLYAKMEEAPPPPASPLAKS
ncbi:hypothetical protein WG922_02075 [Ramlibacter sp. AN1015]|uniref:hypothetical protein n=1 Tax=Ramlibacter sp. AN1015 TaxID=3133428 RepID=UPI0030BA6944